MVNTKFQYTNSESPTLVQMATLSSTGNKSVSTGNALGFTNNQSGGAGQEVYQLVTTYGKILIKTVFK